MRHVGAWLTAALLAAAAPADARWREASSEHFLIYSEQQPQTVKAYAERLERFDKGLRLLHHLPPYQGGRANRLTVYVLPSAAAVQRIANQNGKKQRDVAGFYRPRAANSLAFVTQIAGGADLVLFHEYTHHAMFENSNVAYPAWYSEGLAEFDSTADIKSNGSAMFGMPALHRAYGLLVGSPLSVRTLLTSTVEQIRPDQGDTFYGRSWLLTHYLVFAPERDGQLRSYLQAFNRGTLAAAEKAFGDLKALDRDLDSYLLKRRITALSLPADRTSPGAIAVRELTDGENAIIPVRMRSQSGVSITTAAEVLVDARKIAAGFPSDPQVQVALAEAEFDAGNLSEADAAADRALAGDPKLERAMVYKSMIALRRASLPAAADPALLAAARSWALKANRIEPDDPRPLMHFYSAQAAAGKPTANAVAGLDRAFELAPQDMELRLMLIRQRLADGDFKSARVLLAPIAYSPHSGRAAAFAADLIARIDAGTTDDLLRRLDGMGQEEASPG